MIGDSEDELNKDGDVGDSESIESGEPESWTGIFSLQVADDEHRLNINLYFLTFTVVDEVGSDDDSEETMMSDGGNKEG
jgi:hypothetical protein